MYKLSSCSSCIAAVEWNVSLLVFSLFTLSSRNPFHLSDPIIYFFIFFLRRLGPQRLNERTSDIQKCRYNRKSNSLIKLNLQTKHIQTHFDGILHQLLIFLDFFIIVTCLNRHYYLYCNWEDSIKEQRKASKFSHADICSIHLALFQK